MVAQQPTATRWSEFQRSGAGVNQRTQALEDLRQKMHQFVISELGPILYDQRISEADLRKQVEEQLHKALGQERLALTAQERQDVVQSVFDDVLGYGPIDALLRDPAINEVMVNGPDRVYVERNGKIVQTDVHFVDEGHVRRIIDKIVSQVGRRVDEATPMVDARLPDGSRVNVIVHPLAIGGPFMTIRRFAADPYQVHDLVTFGTITEQVANFVDACIRGRLNVVVSGGTGTGKTTMLNVLSSFIPPDERIITIEDAKELQLQQPHVLSCEGRPSNIEGKGEVTIRDLVRNSLRMRPDRIVVGEVRGGEALDMLQAMNTGHDGSITTVHSNSPRDTLSRIETMSLMAGMDLPIRVIREQMASALDLIVHLTRLRDGTRRVTHVSEVMGMEGDVIVLQDLYLFDYGMGMDEDGKFLGRLKSTGIRPHSTERLANNGISLDSSLFASDSFAATRGSAAMTANLLILGSAAVPVIGALVIGGAVFALAMTLLTMDGDRRSELEKRLTGFAGSETDAELERDADENAESNLMQDMVSLTGRMAERIGVLNRVEDKLEQADLPLRPPEALFLYMAIIVVMFLGSVLIFGPIGALIAIALAVIGPVLYLEMRRKKRLRKFETQLPDVLNLLSGSMRAGFSFAQGLEAVAEEASEPARRELQRVYAESRLGRPIEDALEDSADRMQSIDLVWAVMAIRIQREVGGNLAELLDTVADTMTERERLRHEIVALTAEGRMSAWVLGIFPPAFAVILYMIQPDYMSTLFSSAFGIAAVVISAVMACFGFLWLRKIMAIEV